MIAAAVGVGLLIGLVMGGLGGGGGVLVVPALVYLLGQTAQEATAASAVIVGVTAVVGVLTRLRGGVDRRTALTFGALGVPSAYLGTLLNQQVAAPVLLLAFAATILLAAAALLCTAHPAEPEPDPATGGGTAVRTAAPSRLRTATKVVVCGLTIGFLTGFLGVGGGFLVVPALVVVLGMPMTRAVGTSLAIIVLNAVSSLVARHGGADLDWAVVVPLTLAAVVACVAAARVADRFSGPTLTRAFAVLLLVVGVLVAIQSATAL